LKKTLKKMPKRRSVDETEKVKVKKEKKTDSELEIPEGEEEYKWWLEQNGNDSGIKWTTLEHKGPLFPPLYEPHGVCMKYDGVLVFTKADQSCSLLHLKKSRLFLQLSSSPITLKIPHL
jgi:hypothetical protein